VLLNKRQQHSSIWTRIFFRSQPLRKMQLEETRYLITIKDMKTQCFSAKSSFHWMICCAAMGLASTALAQSQRYYPQQAPAYPQQPQYGQPQYSQPPPSYQPPPANYGNPGYAYPQQPQKRYENPVEFMPKFGKRMGEMFRRLFYGRQPSGWEQPPQGSGYSLDNNPRHQAYPQQQPPPGYYPQQPAQPSAQSQPRYSYPPQQIAPPSTKSSTPTTQSKSNSTTRSYTPPKVGSTPPKTTPPPKISTAPPKPKAPAPAPTPPPTVTTRRSETTAPEPPSKTASSGGSFPKGGKTSKAGRVTSPYAPYKELDVTGLESGSLALDPTTQKVFEVP